MKRKRATLLFCLRVMPHRQPYTKPHRSAADHVAHLATLGLNIPDSTRAQAAIEEIGYYRLRIYFLSRRLISVPGRPFEAGTSFDHIMEIYEFDQQLRLECFRVCSRVEIIFRSAISEVLSSQYGAHPYDNPAVFADKDRHMDAYKEVIETFKKKKPSDPRAKDYFERYYPPIVPPIWTMKELWTFGAANTFYKTLSTIVANQIARRLNVIDREVLTSWTAGLLDVRNVCGHHDRLFNRSFQKTPKLIRHLNLPSKRPANKLHSQLECAQHIVRAFEAGYDCMTPISRLITNTQAIRPSEIGF